MTPPLHNRRSIRLRHFDYASPGSYFVTICAQCRKPSFGEIVGGEMRLNDLGRIVDQVWNELPQHFPSVRLDSFVVMPNHMHCIIILTDTEQRARLNHAPTDGQKTRSHALGHIVNSLKSFSTRKINVLRRTPGMMVWQRNFHEHIIRNQIEMERIRRYIHENPMRWEMKHRG